MSNCHTESAFPHLDESCQRVNEIEYTPGLTKRELFAAMAMQGLVSSISQYSKTKDGSPITESHVVQQAVVFADALIAALTDETIHGDKS